MMDNSDREMHKATCSDCGKECEVPFKPTQGKPVRCQDCFRKNKPKRSFDRSRRFGSDRGPRREREMFKAVCAKCKKDCEVPFKPSGDKPVLCKDCFIKEREDQVGKFD